MLNRFSLLRLPFFPSLLRSYILTAALCQGPDCFVAARCEKIRFRDSSSVFRAECTRTVLYSSTCAFKLTHKKNFHEANKSVCVQIGFTGSKRLCEVTVRFRTASSLH